MQTIRRTAYWVGSQLSGSLSKNFSEVVKHFWFFCFTARTPIFDSIHSLILPLMSSYWLCFYWSYKETSAIARAFACGNKHCCSSAAIQAQGYEEHLQKNAHWMQEHFLSCLHFVPSHNTWNLNDSISDQALLYFAWKKLFPSQKSTTSTKPQVVSFIKDWRQSYSVWCLDKRKYEQMLLSYTKWIDCEGRTHLTKYRQLRIGTGLSL